MKSEIRSPTPDILESLTPEVLDKIRRTLVNYETAYQHASGSAEFSSLWVHSARVARIAYHLAESEGVDTNAALLAGLLHDVGKFADGKYHENGVVEEETASEISQRLLAETPYDGLIPLIREAILSLYREEFTANEVGHVVYDADRLDKLGHMGIAQFFAKNALRQHFLDSKLMVRASIELTYAHHASATLKTSTGREFAKTLSQNTRRFYIGLLEEWRRLGLGSFSLREEVIEEIVCVLVVPDICQCGHRIEVESDIREAVKCRAAVVVFTCSKCGPTDKFTFCLPNVKGFPWRHDCL